MIRTDTARFYSTTFTVRYILDRSYHPLRKSVSGYVVRLYVVRVRAVRRARRGAPSLHLENDLTIYMLVHVALRRNTQGTA